MAAGKAKRRDRGRAVPKPSADRGASRLALALAGSGLVLSGLALADDPRRFSFAYLWGFSLLWAVVLGCLFFVVLQHLTRSIWSVVVRRVAEAFASHAWFVAVAAVPVLIFAWKGEVFHLFSWLDPNHLAHDEVLAGKTPYLNLTFFALRLVGFVVLWTLFARYYVGKSLGQDDEPNDAASIGMRRWSPLFMLVFAVTMTFASFDWLMSLNPHWFSTIFGVYVFAGMFVTALSVVVLGVTYLDRAGRLDKGLIRSDHLYPLGGLLFGMSCFWAYIAFSQFMLIWYGNLPEETVFFTDRLRGGWRHLSVLLPILRFVIPFAVLIGLRAKTNPKVLVAIALLVLLGEALDLYWLIMPQLHVESPALSWPELGPPLLVIGCLLLLWTRFFAKHAPVAKGDPLLPLSREFHL